MSHTGKNVHVDVAFFLTNVTLNFGNVVVSGYRTSKDQRSVLTLKLKARVQLVQKCGLGHKSLGMSNDLNTNLVRPVLPQKAFIELDWEQWRVPPCCAADCCAPVLVLLFSPHDF